MSLGTGLDAGHHKVRLAQLRNKKGEISLQRYYSETVEGGEAPMEAAGGAFGRLSKKPTPARVGLTGSDLMMRYLPVPPVEDWRLERLMDFEVRELESRSGSPLATSFNLLPVPKELDEDDTILLGLVREDLLEEWMGLLDKLPVQGFTPNAIALYNAYLALGDHEASVTLLANVGATTLDLCLVRGTDLYFARSVTTGLDKRDASLGQRLGVSPQRAQSLIHKHMDLRGGIGQRLETDPDRVTRPVLPFYDPLPTLLSSVVTLCKAQARLQDLSLDRVLLTGGGAKAKGITEFFQERMRVPVSVWNPVEMVDLSALPPEQADPLEEDGPAASVALGLALSAADADLYALEILPKAARKRREFQERGIFAVIAAALVIAFLAFDFFVTSSQATDLAADARRLRIQVDKASKADAEARGLLEEVQRKTGIVQELQTRRALQQSAWEMYETLLAALPDNLWVESFAVELQEGKDWGLAGVSVPVVTVGGRGQDASRPARTVFNRFVADLKSQLPRGEDSIRETAKPRGRDLEWSISAQLLVQADPDSDEEYEDE
ncbi:MAG: hypothetical protein DWQ01_15635 [Planctomycetota bacterium]|nr:MAG: hypothetical protein DWQ01_15635 [Planctomycetota bacterium]